MAAGSAGGGQASRGSLAAQYAEDALIRPLSGSVERRAASVRLLSRQSGSRETARAEMGKCGMAHRVLMTCLVAVGIAVAGCGAAQGAGSAPGQALPANASQASTGNTSAASGPGPADASLAGIHACKLISASVVRSALGSLSSPPAETASGLHCLYEQAVPGGVGLSVTVTILERSGYDAAKEFTQAANGVQGTRYVPVSGIGDDAYASIGHQSYVLSAARGGRAISMQIDSISPAARQAAIELMRSAIVNL